MGGSAFDLVDGPVFGDEETAFGDVRLLRRGIKWGRLWPFWLRLGGLAFGQTLDGGRKLLGKIARAGDAVGKTRCQRENSVSVHFPL
jgi:hypothetical protein